MSVAQLRSIFAKGAQWNDAWSASVTPWDHGPGGSSQPALVQVLKAKVGELGYFPWRELKDKKALVAGCGRVSIESAMGTRFIIDDFTDESYR